MDKDYISFSPSDERAVAPEPEVNWSDYGTALRSGVSGVQKSIAGAQQYMLEKASQDPAAMKDSLPENERQLYSLEQQVINSQLSEGARRIKSASLLPKEGQESAWDNIGRWIALNGVESAPSLVASIVPAAVLSPFIGATAAGLAGGAAAGAINAGDLYNDIVESVESKSDDFLKEHSPSYAGYRSIMDEADARAMLRSDMAGWKPVIAGAFTMLTSKYGVEGMVARKAGGEAAMGRIKHAGVGFLGEATQEGGEQFLNEVLSGTAQKDAGIGDIEWRDAIAKSLDAAAIGGVMGAGTGFITGGGHKEQSPPPSVPPKGNGTGNVPPPPVNPNIGNTVNPPSGSDTNYNKAQAAKDTSRRRSGVEIADGPVDSTIGAAMSASDAARKLQGLNEPVTPEVPPQRQPQMADPAQVQKLRGLNIDEEPAKRVSTEPTPEELDEIWAEIESKRRANREPDVAYDYELPDAGEPRLTEEQNGKLWFINENRGIGEKMTPTQFLMNGEETYQRELRGANGNPTTTETKSQIDGQLAELTAGKRKAVFVKPGEKVKVPEGFEKVSIRGQNYPADARGTYIFNPKTTSKDEIRKAARTNETMPLFGGAETTKEQALAGTPLGLQKVNKDGAATIQQATNTERAAQDAAKIAENMQPGDTLELVPPETVTPAREAGAPKAPGGQTIASAGPLFEVQQPTSPAEKAKQVSKKREAKAVTPKSNADAGPLFNAPQAAQTVPTAPAKKGISKMALQAARRRAEQEVAAAEKGPQAGHRTIAEKEQRARIERSAEDAFFKHTPGDDEVYRGPDQPDLLRRGKTEESRFIQTPKQAMALRKRLERLVADVEKQGAIPEKAYEGQSDYLVYARQAKDALKYVGKQSKEALEKTNAFITDEAAARKGDFEPMRKRRLEEGDLAKRQNQAGSDIDNVRVDTTTDKGRRLTENTSTESPDQALERAERTALENKVMAEIDRQIEERGTVYDLDKLGEMVGRKIESVAEIENALAAKPEPKKLPKKKAAPNSSKPKDRIDRLKRIAEYQAKRKARAQARASEVRRPVLSQEELQRYLNGGTQKVTSTRVDGVKPSFNENEVVNDGARAESLQTMTLADALNRFHNETLKGFEKLASGFFGRRLRNLAGDVKVKFVEPGSPVLTINGRRAAGYYDPRYDHIVISLDTMLDPSTMRRVLVHEAAHAAFYHALRNNPNLSYFTIKLLNAAREEATRQGIKPDAVGAYKGKFYGLTDFDEFISEAWANEEFRHWLRGIDMHPQDKAFLEKQFDLRNGFLNTMWDWFRAVVARAFNLKSGEYTMLDAALRISDALNQYVAENGRNVNTLVGDVKPAFRDDVMKGAADTATNFGTKVRRVLDKARTAGMIAREMTEDTFKGTDAPMRAHQLRRAIDTERAKIVERVGGEELINDHVTLQSANPEQYEKMTDLGYRFTMNDANPGGEKANQHFGKNKKKYWQARTQLAELDAEFNALEPAYRELLTRTSDTFKQIQNEASLLEIKNILDKIGIDEPGLAERLHDKGMTDADREKFDSNIVVNELEKSLEFKKIEGLYLPAMRRGSHVVGGHVDLEVPKTAVMAINPETNKAMNDTLVFDGGGNYAQAQRDVQSYLEGNKLNQLSIEEIYVSPKNPGLKLDDSDPAATRHALRVRMQTQFTEFVDNEAAGLQLAKEMREKGLKDVFVEPKETTLSKTKNVYSPDMDRIADALKKDEKFRNLDEDGQEALLRTLREAGLRFNGDHSLGHRKMYRRKVAGFSTDLVRNTQDYLGQAAGYVARLMYSPKIDAAFKEMEAYRKEHLYENDAMAIRRREQLEALRDRIYAPDETTRAPIIQFLTKVSMINKLGGISWHIVNAHEPWTVGAAYLAGRFRAFEVANAMRKSYGMLGAGGALKAGGLDTIRALKQDRGFTNYQDFFMQQLQEGGIGGERLNRISEMFDDLHKYGVFDRESGMEATRSVDPQQNIAMKGLDKADVFFRQMAQAMEAINRGVVGLTAYELEYARTKNHEAAKQYAFEAVHDTMGDYSSTNASPYFKGNFGALALQFKKYGQKQYWLLGRAFKKMVQGDVEARRQFIGYMFTHAAVAGLMGLPGLEFVKIALIAAGAMGAGYDYDDFEDLVRSSMANLLGKQGGELASKGLYRGIGIDMSSRLGQDSLLSFGQPKSMKQQDLKTWLFDTAAGAPIGTVLSQIEAMQRLQKEDYLGAAEKSALPKFAVDLVKAYRGATDGKISESGRQTLTPYSPYETALRAVGLTPSRESEQGRFRARANEVSKKADDERRKLMTDWLKAAPDDRARMWGRIERWNKTQPEEARLNRKDLQSAQKRRESEKDKTVNTVVTNRRNERIVNEYRNIYNLKD